MLLSWSTLKVNSDLHGHTNTSQAPVGWLGVHSQNKGDAAVVTNVNADSSGAQAGIQVGDILLALDGRLIRQASAGQQCTGAIDQAVAIKRVCQILSLAEPSAIAIAEFSFSFGIAPKAPPC